MTLSELFETFETSAFRLEGLPNYAVDDEKSALDFYKKTGQLPNEYGTDWYEFVKDKTSSGKSIQRLRLVSEQLTAYETFELHAYTGLKGGEDIRFARRSNQPYAYDFWLFDNRWLARMDYDEAGRYSGSAVSELTSKEQKYVTHWRALYERSPSISELLTS